MLITDFTLGSNKNIIYKCSMIGPKWTWNADWNKHNHNSTVPTITPKRRGGGLHGVWNEFAVTTKGGRSKYQQTKCKMIRWHFVRTVFLSFGILSFSIFLPFFRTILDYLRPSIHDNHPSMITIHPSHPLGPRFPREPASRLLRFLRACWNAYFATSIRLVGLIASPSE